MSSQRRAVRPEGQATHPRPAGGEILAAATRVFGSKGYHQGSLVDVAAQVGITHAGVLHHFGSKDKLLWEVLEYRDRVDVQHLEGKHIPGGIDLFRHLVITARLNADRRGIVQAYAVLTGESVTDGHPASTWVADRFAVLRGEISQAVRELADERAVTLPEGERRARRRGRDRRHGRPSAAVAARPGGRRSRGGHRIRYRVDPDGHPRQHRADREPLIPAGQAARTTTPSRAAGARSCSAARPSSAA